MCCSEKVGNEWISVWFKKTSSAGQESCCYSNRYFNHGSALTKILMDLLSKVKNAGEFEHMNIVPYRNSTAI